MNVRLLSTPALALLLAACQATATLTPRPAATAGSARPTATPAGTPSGARPPGPAATPAASGLRLDRPTPLQAPPGTTIKLAGALRLDPITLDRLGASRLNGGLVVANNGAALVADSTSWLAAGGGIISDNGGGVVANNGSSVIANNGSGVVANNGSSVIANNGGGIISNHGGAFSDPAAIAVASGNLVACAGAGFGELSARGAAGAVGVAGAAALAPAAGVAPAGARFSLAQVGGAGAAGQPAAGMLVSVASLQTGRFLPLGEDAEGRPVYTIYTNAAGGFEAWLPPDAGRNVLIAAALPGRPQEVVKAGVLAAAAQPAVVDEETAAVTGFMRRSMAARLASLMASPSPTDTEVEVIGPSKLGGNAVAQQVIATMIRKIHALAMQRGVPTTADPALRAARAQALAQAVTDAALTEIDPATFVIDPNFDPKWRDAANRPPGVPAEGAQVLETLTTCFRELRRRAQATMADPAGGYKPLPADFTQRVAIGDDPSPWYHPEPGDGDWFVEILDRYPPRAIALATPDAVIDHLLDTYMAVNRVYTVGPSIAAYAMLDPQTYPTRLSMFDVQPDQAGLTAALEKLRGRLPGVDVQRTDPQFDVARRAAALGYGLGLNIAGTTLLMYIGFALLDDESPISRAVATAGAAAPLP